MNIIITIPAYNEGSTIKSAIENIINAMKSTRYKYKILVVDDGSKDNTYEIAKNTGAIVYKHNQNLGLAQTFRTEMEKCLENNADIIVHFDADNQYLASEIPLLIGYVEKGYDLVLGSRFLGKIEYMPWLKRFGNKAFSEVISKICSKKISDAQTGFRAFKKDVAKNIQVTSNYTYTQEQVIRCIKKGYRVIEVPVYFARRNDKSRLMKNPFHYAAKAGINLLRVYRDYEPLKFFCSIGIMSLSIGLILGIYLIYLHFTTGIVGHTPLIIFTTLTLIAGLQIILFGFLADMLRKA
ncbi:glycosyltransferase family 2 protein [Candidatus Woesearchaeota archaeon]|nr:glycosyltransferase family 2 protein [Candidatus Woesearchaeota archaeon]